MQRNHEEQSAHFKGAHVSPLDQRARRGILMPRGKNCRETIFPLNCRAISLTTGAILKEEKCPQKCGKEAIWEAFLRDNLGEGN